jgi:hypothetical protein
MSLVRLIGADNNNKLTTINTTTEYTIIAKLVEDCYEEEDIDKKVQILYKINSLLPKSCCINIPSLITDDYIEVLQKSLSNTIMPLITKKQIISKQ